MIILLTLLAPLCIFFLFDIEYKRLKKFCMILLVVQYITYLINLRQYFNSDENSDIEVTFIERLTISALFWIQFTIQIIMTIVICYQIVKFIKRKYGAQSTNGQDAFIVRHGVNYFGND